MALQKEIIFENGVKINYHKIDKVSFDGKKTIVKVLCYVDDSYRIKEKANFDNMTKYETLLNNILEENKKEQSKRNIKQVKEWSEEANKLVGTFKDEFNLSVVNVDFEFDNLTDLSFSNLYKLLKEDEMFKDSKDLL